MCFLRILFFLFNKVQPQFIVVLRSNFFCKREGFSVSRFKVWVFRVVRPQELTVRIRRYFMFS